MIADYYFIRKQQLNLKELYSYTGRYTFGNGFNTAAIVALVLGIAPNIPGFLTTIHVLSKDAVWPWVDYLYNYAWFVGFFISGLVYLVMMQKQKETVNELTNLNEGDLNVSSN